MPSLRERFVLALLFAGVVAVRGADAGRDLPPHPLTLPAAVNFALQHNPELRRVQQQVTEQQGVVMEATARQKPGVRVGASYGYTQPRLFEGIPGFPEVPLPNENAWQVSVNVRQVVYSGGATEAQMRSARARTDAARSILTAAVNQTVFQTEENFLGVLLAREQIAVHAESLRVLERERDEAKTRRRAGTGSDFEIMRADVAVANARPALIRAQNAYRARQDALAAVLGIDSGLGDVDLDVQGRLETPAVTIPLGEAIQTARQHRPELQANADAIAAARDDVKAAEAGRKPQVSLVGGYDYMKQAYSAGLGDTLNGFRIGAQVDWSIFDGHATKARVHQANARAAQAEAARDTTRLKIDLEVRDAHRALTEAADLESSAETVIDEAKESLRLAQARLGAGTATQLDVLTAETALTEARSNLSQAQYDYAVGAARLRRAMGTATAATE